jgi:hypothetical protein
MGDDAVDEENIALCCALCCVNCGIYKVRCAIHFFPAAIIVIVID